MRYNRNGFLHCFSRASGRKLDRKQSNWDTNQHTRMGHRHYWWQFHVQCHSIRSWFGFLSIIFELLLDTFYILLFYFLLSYDFNLFILFIGVTGCHGLQHTFLTLHATPLNIITHKNKVLKSTISLIPLFGFVSLLLLLYFYKNSFKKTH